MALTVNEDWIRERVGLKHNNLEDVRSLSLPGTYHEKIENFGESLRKFTRIKSLDLSRNSIESLAGLETLKLLEKLNLYYNGITSLQELYRLRYNQKLQDLDLRLNPVARNEPDYRLFLIHMLPSLRRLDDRAVRDSERKAALMHFTSDQANDLTEHPKVAENTEQGPNPRVEHVKTLAKPPNVLDEDDVNVLEYMNPHRGEITGSDKKEANVEDYPPEMLRNLNRAGIGMEGVEQQQSLEPLGQQQYPHPVQGDTAMLAEFQAKYPNLPIITTTGPSGDPRYDLHTQAAQQRQDPNLKYQDEIEAYTSYKTQGHFTAKPDQEPGPQTVIADTQTATRSMELYTAEDLENDLQKLNQKVIQAGGEPLQPFHPNSQKPFPQNMQLGFNPNQQQSAHANRQQQHPENKELSNEQHHQGQVIPEEDIQMEITGDTGEFIKKMSALVDKYWNGSRSLLKNVRFKGQMTQMCKDYRQVNNDTQSISSIASTNASLEFEMSRLKQSLEKVKKENEGLKEKLFQASSFDSLTEVDESKLKQSYVRAQRDVKILRDRLQKSIEDNKTLQDELARGGQNKGNNTAGEVKATEIATIQRENSQLQRQIEGLNIKLKQHHQMQELAAMLQESHKSLVQTNDHLLKEMEETRQRHKLELQQLTWNYNQLKRAVGQANIQNYNGQ